MRTLRKFQSDAQVGMLKATVLPRHGIGHWYSLFTRLMGREGAGWANVLRRG